MKILVLAWEFPPRIIGGISRHVAELYPELVKLGHQICLITVATENAPPQEIVEGIEVHRISVDANQDFFAWIDEMNQKMESYVDFLRADLKSSFDLVHAHDWLVADAAIAIMQKLQISLVATIHATEYGRNNGIHTDANRHIHFKESSLAAAAQRIIVCSKYMQGEVERAFQCLDTKVDVVYNGLNLARTTQLQHQDFDPIAWRAKYAESDQKIIYYVGRITHEKGIFILLNAAPKILTAMEGKAKFVIIGSGDDHAILLKRQAWDLGIAHKVVFTGFMSDSDLGKFQLIADCAVFPSLYEPFGIVALESFAANMPIVVSNTGGLPEVVQDRVTGIVAKVNDPDSLAAGILQILQNPDYAKQLVKAARIDLEKRFCWQAIALQTEIVYKKTCFLTLRKNPEQKNPELDP
jgi:glycosyltransferase involved in cell wall biosynthesis